MQSTKYIADFLGKHSKYTCFFVCLRWCFTFYHGKSRLNHHLGGYVVLSPTTLSKCKSKTSRDWNHAWKTRESFPHFGELVASRFTSIWAKQKHKWHSIIPVGQQGPCNGLEIIPYNLHISGWCNPLLICFWCCHLCSKTWPWGSDRIFFELQLHWLQKESSS